VTVSEIAKTKAVSLFYTFYHHPEYRGPKFTWEGFPEMARNHVEAEIFIHLERSPTKEEKSLAGQIAFKEAQRLVTETKP
jgi:hypothetical protein